MKTWVEINRLQVYANHGVAPQETRVGNLFEVSARLCYDFSEAAAGDDIGLALNYAELVDVINDVMSHPRRLLETVAFDIRSALLRCWPGIRGGSIYIAKVHPPFSSKVESAAVEVEW